MIKRRVNFSKIMAVIFMVVLSCVLSVAPVNAASTLRDYDEISNLATKYSYGTLFYTEDTEMEVISHRWINYDAESSVSNWDVAFGADAGDVVKVKLTNCAIDEDGDMCDVIFTVDNVKKYAITETDSIMGAYKQFFPNISFASSDRIVANVAINNIFEIADKNDPGSSNTTKYSAINPGDLIAFNLETNCGRADFTLDYYKAGTSQKANINGSIAIIYDLDVTNWTGEGESEMFGGQEGVLSLYDGETYYDKGSAVEARDGGVSAIRGSNNTNGLAKKSSVFLVQNEKGTFKMRYGGTGCGILYSFVSPYAYTVENPSISVDKERVYEGETFTYSVNQYVPNNYYSKYLNFFDNYNGMYSSLKIEDTVNSNLTINGNVKVVNEMGTDVTSYFNVTKSGNKVTATLKAEYLESIDFYSHLYTLKIPVKYNSGAGKNVSSVSNNATRTIVTNGTQDVKTTDNVNVGLKYDIKTTGTISNGTITIKNSSTTTSITDTTTTNHSSNVNTVVKFKPDSIYELASVTVNGSAININSLTKNAAGEYEYTFVNNNVNQNIEQNIVVTTSLIKTSLSGTKIWTDENDKLGFRPGSYTLKLYADNVYMKEATFTTNTWSFNDLVKYNVGSKQEINYTVQEDDIVINEYDKYTGVVNGTVVENKLVRTPSTVIVKYVDNIGNELAPDETLNGFGGEAYTTSRKPIDGYRACGSDPDNANGTYAAAPTTVTYVYERIPASLTVNYIDKTTGSLIMTQIIGGYVYDTKTTEAKNLTGYTLIEKPSKEEYTLTEEDQVVNYYYALNTRVVVKHLDLYNHLIDVASQEIISGYVGKDYTTAKSENHNYPNYTYVSCTANTAGQMTRDEIVVEYYYVKGLTVNVRYVDKVTNQDIDVNENVVINENQGEEYTTTKKEFEGYIYIGDTGNTSGTVGSQNLEVIYYYSPASTVIVKHLDKYDHSIEVAPGQTISGYIGKNYGTNVSSSLTLPNYVYSDCTNNTSGQMTREPIIVEYYYIKESEVRAKYIDENTGNQIAGYPDISGIYKEASTYTTQELKIPGYTLTRVDGNKTGVVGKDNITVTYYYKKNTSITVKHVDKYEKSIVLKSETENGLEGDDYTTANETFNGYVYAQEVEGKANGKMEAESLTITYYYIKQSNLITEHVDAITGEKIIADVVTTYDEKENYKALPQNIPGYVLVEEPEVAEGVMGRENVTKTFKYKKISAGLVVKYIDEVTNEELDEKVYGGKENDVISLEELTFDGYILTRRPASSEVTLTVNGIETHFYYKKIVDLEVVGIDQNTGAEIYSKIQSGVEGTEYTTKPLEIPSYVIVEEPDNKNGIYDRNNQKVVYVYKQKAEDVTVKYVDIQTNEVLENYTISGFVGDEYTTEQNTYEDYNFVRVEGNPQGTLGTNASEVTYYYQKKEGKVIVTYKDIDGNILLTEEHTGKVKEEFSIEEVEFENYNFVEKPESTTGKYIDGTIELTYVLEKIRGKIKVNFIDRDGNVLFDSVFAEGDLNEEFYLEALEKEGYIIAENAKIQINYIDGEIVIDVIYEKIPEPPATGDIDLAMYVAIMLFSLVVFSKKIKKVLR